MVERNKINYIVLLLLDLFKFIIVKIYIIDNSIEIVLYLLLIETIINNIIILNISLLNKLIKLFDILLFKKTIYNPKNIVNKEM
jgi:hypothetical protein